MFQVRTTLKGKNSVCLMCTDCGGKSRLFKGAKPEIPLAKTDWQMFRSCRRKWGSLIYTQHYLCPKCHRRNKDKPRYRSGALRNGSV